MEPKQISHIEIYYKDGSMEKIDNPGKEDIENTDTDPNALTNKLKQAVSRMMYHACKLRTTIDILSEIKELKDKNHE